MDIQSDTDPLGRLAAALGVDIRSQEFRFVWAVMGDESGEGWTAERSLNGPRTWREQTQTCRRSGGKCYTTISSAPIRSARG